MPQTKQESLLFAVTMTTGMVLIMGTYRMYIGAGALYLLPWVITMIRSWIIAFFVDKLIAHPLAMKMIQWTKVSQKAPKQTGNLVSLTKLLTMTTIMSLLGMVFAGAPITLVSYPISWMISIVVSAPASFLVVGPLARKVLALYRAKTQVTAS